MQLCQNLGGYIWGQFVYEYCKSRVSFMSTQLQYKTYALPKYQLQLQYAVYVAYYCANGTGWRFCLSVHEMIL